MSQKLNKEEAKKRIKKLRQEIERHNYLYYVLDKPEISDAEWDAMFHELRDLEEQYPEFITNNSPTVRIGGKVLDKFNKVVHKDKMMSLNDAKNKTEVQEWYNRIIKLLPTDTSIDFYCEYKFDGLSISTIYKKGEFVLGATRGDGYIGEDVTENLKTIKTIPLKLFKDVDAEVRGEVILTKKEFERVNKEQEKLGLPLYANPRNLAAGSVRQLNSKITASRHLDFVAYKLVTDLGQKTHKDEHEIIEKLGFKTTNKENCYAKNLDEVFQYYDKVEQNRDKLSFEIDGIVILINDNKIFNLLGNIGKGPRGGIALKFPAKEVITIVEDIKVQVGRTGILTPVAFLKPVFIGGTKVSRATLHNKEEIKRLGLKIYDHVVLSRAGDVIPKITKVLDKLRTGEERDFKMPSYCPVCHTLTIQDDSGILVKCPNPKCPARSQENLKHFVSKQGFDIKGVGSKLLQKFVDEHLIVDSADLFSLEEGDLKVLERLGEKSSKNIIQAINNSKNITLEKFIVALGIPLVGIEAARGISQKLKKYGSINTPGDVLAIASKISIDEWNKIYDFGPKVSKSIVDFFCDNNTKQFFDKLDRAGIHIQNERLLSNNSNFKDLKFIFTGELKSMTRAEAQEKVKELGGIVKETMSRDIDYVIVGEHPGNKLEKAKQWGIKILNENEFINLIKKK